MYSLTCPACQTNLSVAPAQAGDKTACPQCHAVVQVPKLGELRKLPTFSGTSMPVDAPPASKETSPGRQAGFMIAGVVATLSLLMAGYCGIRWAIIERPITTHEHLDMFREAYEELPGANLIREWEEMEKYGIDLVQPYTYKRIATEKRGWGNKSVTFGSVAVVCIAAAAALGRRARTQTPTT